MSRLTDLIARARVKDSALGEELEKEFKALSARRAFGLNFERHKPESVELPGRPVRKGDKVRILAVRGSNKKGDQTLWKVQKIGKTNNVRFAELEQLDVEDPQTSEVAVDDLVVVAEFRDYIYPGLVSTGKVERGGDKPYHTVINGENFHVLEALTYTHRGKIDAIYIDPPYNSGAKDWKYNNNYVDKEDVYRHSKWLAMLERRLTVAKELLNPKKSVLIVTIDEKEYLRLGLLLEQLFPEANMQMISSSINPKGSARGKEFYRVDEYIFYLTFGDSVIQPYNVPGLCITKADKDFPEDTQEAPESEETKDLPAVRWASLLRSGSGAQREESHLKYYPIFVDVISGNLIGCGDPLPLGQNPKSNLSINGNVCEVWPTRSDGSQGRWQLQVESFRDLLEKKYVRVGKISKKKDKVTFYYLMEGQREKLQKGELIITGQDEYGGIVVEYAKSSSISMKPKTQWNSKFHSATDHGTSLLRKLIPGRKFPFPKSLYAVEDSLRFVIGDNKEAIILDFFSGSGTTAHAVMRLNRQDGGCRQSISVTNNEVGAKEASSLRKSKLRPGDSEWERNGICEHITKPRIKAAITGHTPESDSIEGKYVSIDTFPIQEGFEESAEFFNLTYETPVAVRHNVAFKRIAPLLWMRAGAKGRRIEIVPNQGWDLVEAYGVLVNLDQATNFCKALKAKNSVRIAYIVTDDDRRFQSVTRHLPESVEPVRLYESYLSNFRFSMGR